MGTGGMQGNPKKVDVLGGIPRLDCSEVAVFGRNEDGTEPFAPQVAAVYPAPLTGGRLWIPLADRDPDASSEASAKRLAQDVATQLGRRQSPSVNCDYAKEDD